MISPGTKFEIIAIDGKNPEKSIEFPLNFQQIFSAFSNNDGLMQKKAVIFKKGVLREKNIYVKIAKMDIEFQTLSISSALTDKEIAELTNLIIRYQKLFPKKGQ